MSVIPHDTIGVPSHHPSNYAGDFLGYTDYADALLNQIDILNAENTGITFGIFGQWGIGKSSVLRMLKDRLKGTGRYLIVEFEAWRYLEQEDLWLAFLRKIMGKIEEQGILGMFMVSSSLAWDRFRKSPNFIPKLLQLIVVVVAIVILIGFFIVALLVGYANKDTVIPWLLAGGTGIALLVTLLTKMFDITSSAINRVGSNFPQMMKPGFDQEQSVLIDDFIADFQAIVRKRIADKTIVVLIDDLDRCPPNQVIPVLESIKHFSIDDLRSPLLANNKPLILFVLAIDRDAIEESVRGYFKDYFLSSKETKKTDLEVAHFARGYVEKIIQIHFELPPLTSEQLDELLTKLLEKVHKENPRLDLSTALEIKKILTLNPLGQPRAVLQAYSAFLNRWEIVHNRQIQDIIDPKTLAVLLVMQYVWPGVFKRICIYPQHFFYLHALTTGVGNEFCGEVEIDEIRELGLAADENETHFAPFRDNKFAALMSELSFLGWSGKLRKLTTHLRFSKDEHQSQVQSEQIWEVLQSGDPIRIRYVFQEDRFKVTEIFKRYILGYLAELSDQTGLQQSAVSVSDIAAGERAFVAAGIIYDEQAVPIIVQLLQNGLLPPRLQARAIFTLGHYAADDRRDAITALINIALGKQNLSQSVRTRALHLIRYCDLADEGVSRLLDEIKLQEPAVTISLLRAVLRETIIHGKWRKLALDLIDPSCFSPQDVIDFSSGPKDTPAGGSWPERFSIFFIDLVVKQSGFEEDAYTLLRTHQNLNAVIGWMATLSVAMAKDQQPYEPGIRRCWDDMAQIQNKRLSIDETGVWHTVAWKSIAEYLNEASWPEQMVGIVSIMSKIEAFEAVNQLREMYTLAPRIGSWRRTIRQEVDLVCAQKGKVNSLLQEKFQEFLEEIKMMESEAA